MQVWAERARLQFAHPTQHRREHIDSPTHSTTIDRRVSTVQRWRTGAATALSEIQYFVQQLGLLCVLRSWRSNHSFKSNSPTRKVRGITARRKQFGLLLKAGLEKAISLKVNLPLSLSLSLSHNQHHENSTPYVALPTAREQLTLYPHTVHRPPPPQTPPLNGQISPDSMGEILHNRYSTTITSYLFHPRYLT